MARTSVTTQKVSYTGANTAGASPTAEGDIVDTGGTVFLLVSNTGASAATVTVQTPATYDSLAVEDLAVSLPAGSSKAIGPLRRETFGFPAGDANAGRAFVDYTGTVADLKRTVLSLT